MDRSIHRNGLINLLLLLAVGIAAFVAARFANTLAGLVSVAFFGLGVLVAAASWFQMRLHERERLEKLEFDELARSHSQTALFEARDSEVFRAQRSREQFERYFIPIFTGLLAIGMGVAALLLWRWLARPATAAETVKEPGMALALFGLFALVLFLLGKFSATMARSDENRLLRPGASYLLLSAYLAFAVLLGVIAVEADFIKADLIVARILCALLALIGIETIINLVLEIYRPRVRGKIERPLYESRLVGLLGQPEGLITTATQAIDYQFGFKVSETWFYRLFVERALVWLVLAQLGLLLLSTCFVVIGAGEQGLLEHYGKSIPGRSLLDPGLHLKWPWPIDHVTRYSTDQIQSFEVGAPPPGIEVEEHQNEEGAPHVILWTVAHTREAKEDNFLVANRIEGRNEVATGPAGRRTPPLSLITGTIPVQFQVTNLMLWAYQNEDPKALLEDVATREVVRYFVGADMNNVMSNGRFEASLALASRIQTAADSLKLGARVLGVSLQDIHPPVKVAPEYEKVIGATQTKEAKILNAQAEAIRTNALASAQATNYLNQAVADKVAREIGAVARAALFTNQLPAFHAAPSVYIQRSYLQAFTRATANARKYVLLTTNTHDVLQFDLQDHVREDILRDISVPAPKPKTP